jgi:hypothetical protein
MNGKDADLCARLSGDGAPEDNLWRSKGFFVPLLVLSPSSITLWSRRKLWGVRRIGLGAVDGPAFDEADGTPKAATRSRCSGTANQLAGIAADQTEQATRARVSEPGPGSSCMSEYLA